jgi:Holliday junction resolvase RusA-like endonuclease
MIRLVLPLPPSTNKLYGRNRKTGGVYLKKAVREFRLEVWAIVKQTHRKKIYGPCRAVVTFHPRDYRGGDHDNYTKCLWDAVEGGGLIDNDRQMVDVHYRMGPPIPGGSCLLELTEIS